MLLSKALAGSDLNLDMEVIKRCQDTTRCCNGCDEIVVQIEIRSKDLEGKGINKTRSKNAPA
ncbi:MAG: hypothetical protein AAGE61_14975 [Pseudomonadota bacterium]